MLGDVGIGQGRLAMNTNTSNVLTVLDRGVRREIRLPIARQSTSVGSLRADHGSTRHGAVDLLNDEPPRAAPPVW